MQGGNNMPQQQNQMPLQTHVRNISHRQPFAAQSTERSYRSGNTSDRSESANEVENILMGGNHQARRGSMQSAGWSAGPGGNQQPRSVQRSKKSLVQSNPDTETPSRFKCSLHSLPNAQGNSALQVEFDKWVDRKGEHLSIFIERIHHYCVSVFN